MYRCLSKSISKNKWCTINYPSRTFAPCLNDECLKHTDYDAIFKILCERYDAHFYTKISGTEQTLYDGVKTITDQAFALMDKYKNPVIYNQGSEIIFAIGDTSITEIQLSDVFLKVRSLLEKIQNYCEYINE